MRLSTLNKGKSVCTVGTANDEFGEITMFQCTVLTSLFKRQWLVAGPGLGLCVHQNASFPYENANSSLYIAGKSRIALSTRSVLYDAKICQKSSWRSPDLRLPHTPALSRYGARYSIFIKYYYTMDAILKSSWFYFLHRYHSRSNSVVKIALLSVVFVCLSTNAVTLEPFVIMKFLYGSNVCKRSD